MKKLAIVLAVGAAALFGGSAANAADNSVTAKATTDAAQSSDMSARRKHWRHRHHRVHRHHIHRSHYRPYYGSYGYAPGAYYAPRYYGGGGPGISFGFGGGGGHRGGGWGHHRGW